MTHYICTGTCKGVSDTSGTCQAEDCVKHGEALEPCVICSISETTVRNLLSLNPSLGLRFLRHAAADLDAAEEMALNSATLPVRARFAHFLLVLRDRYGVVGKNGDLTLDLPVSRQDMAAMIGIPAGERPGEGGAARILATSGARSIAFSGKSVASSGRAPPGELSFEGVGVREER